MGLVGGTYQAWLFPPLRIIDSGLFIGPQWGQDAFQVVFYSLVALMFAALPAFLVAGAMSLLFLPMSEEHRGILAFSVMIGSLIPIVILALNALYDSRSLVPLLPLWPFLIVAIVWIVLLWMGVKVLRRTTSTAF